MFLRHFLNVGAYNNVTAEILYLPKCKMNPLSSMCRRGKLDQLLYSVKGKIIL
jgi:hypothetical protein